MDHYATLRVARTADSGAIRAAYLALMRRYHPDANPSPLAAERVRAITVAYSVLSNHSRRAAYDREWQFEHVQPSPRALPRRMAAGPINFAVTLLFLSLIVAGVWLQQPVMRHPTRSAIERDPAASAGQQLSEGSCGTSAPTASIKVELVRQASELAANDRAGFLADADGIDIWVGPPSVAKAESLGRIDCTAAVVVQLPAGLALRDGRQTLIGDIDYSLNADGSGRNPTFAFVAPPELIAALASLHKLPLAQDQVELAVAPETASATLDLSLQRAEARDIDVRPPVLAPTQVKTALPPPPRRKAAPTSRCSGVGERWAVLTCESRDLTALTQQLAMFDGQSWEKASPRKRELLGLSRNKFLADRSICQTESCLRQVLLARSKDVAEIMANGSAVVGKKVPADIQ